jgi:hypothetical protein
LTQAAHLFYERASFDFGVLMTHTTFASCLVAFSLFGCGPASVAVASDSSAEVDALRLSLGQHYQANHCEIFVDKITPYAGSHALRAANVWVKILPARLDGSVVEVGFRNAQEGTNSSGPTRRDWANDVLRPFFGASDYFEINFPLSSDFGRNTYRGAFYVKTSNDTFYWVKASTGDDFTFDTRTHDIVASMQNRGTNYNSSIDVAVPTQQQGMEYYNGSRCR